jgi:hypothetical protein
VREGRPGSAVAGEPEATPRPWRISPVREPHRFWIEGPPGSGATDLLPSDRRIVCDFAIYGDAELDAEIEANANLIVRLVNAGGGGAE